MSNPEVDAFELAEYERHNRNANAIEYAMSYLRAVEMTHSDSETAKIVADLRGILDWKNRA